MNSEIFRMQIDRLINIKGIDRPNNMRLNEYYKALKYINDKDFINTVNWIVENYKFNSFPQIWDFKEAKRSACPVPETTYKYGDRDPKYSKEMQKVLWGFRQMDKIRKQVIPDFNGYNTAKSCETMHSFYNLMCEEGRVFSVENEKWVDKRNALTGEYFNPTEFGYPV
jgi:hypothetical protein